MEQQQQQQQRRQQSAEASSRQSETTTGDDSDETEHELATSERDGRTDIDDQQPSVVMSPSLENVTNLESFLDDLRWRGGLQMAAIRDTPRSPSPVEVAYTAHPEMQTAFVWDERRDDEKQQPASEVESEE